MRDYETTIDPDTLAIVTAMPTAEKVARDVLAAIARDHEGKVSAALIKMGWTPPHGGLVSRHARDETDIVNLLRKHKGGWQVYSVDNRGHARTQGSFTPEYAADEIQRLRVLFRANIMQLAPQVSHEEIDAILFPAVPEQPG